MEKKIKQMATDLQKAEHWDFDEESGHFILDREKTAKHLCKMGYSKRSEGEWISVEERLPDNRKFIIVCDKYGNVGEAYYFHSHFEWLNDDEMVEATHWMPFPEPPKMKGGAE